jgi:hypothetical protein
MARFIAGLWFLNRLGSKKSAAAGHFLKNLHPTV